MNKLKDYKNTGKITPIGRGRYECSICRYNSDTPFEAIKCYDKCRQEREEKRLANLSDSDKFWNNLSSDIRWKYTRRYSDFYNDYKNVAEFAYNNQNIIN